MSCNRRKYVIYFLIYIIIPIYAGNSKARAQKHTSAIDPCITATDWNHILIDTSAKNSSSKGILIVTNREYTPKATNGILLNHNLSSENKIRYFLASCADTIWKLAPVNTLTEGLDIINHGENMVLFVHGNGKTFPASLERTARIKNRYNTAMILFDWPSENFDLNLSIENIGQTSRNFQMLLTELESYRREKMHENQNLSLFMHSLGNLYIKKFVEQRVHEKDSVFIDNIILNAAAIEEDNHQDILAGLNIQKRILVVYNQQDFILFGAQFFLQKAMLGNGTNRPYANAYYIDFTPIAEFEHTYFTGIHHFENNNSSVKSFYFNILNGLPLNENELIGGKKNIFLLPE